MKTYLTALQIADMCLPEMPATERGIRKVADRECWPSRKREGRGGGREYCAVALLKALPSHASVALLTRLTSAEPSSPSLPVTANSSVPAVARDLATMADWQRRCADARALILVEVDRRAALVGVDRAIHSLVADAQQNALRADLAECLPLANARGGRSGNRTLSYRTVYRWRSQHQTDGWAALLPADGAREQAVPEWAGSLLKLYRVPTRRSLAAILDDLPAALPEGVPMPSYGQARRFLDRMSVVDRERGRHGPNGLLKFKSHKRRSTAGLQPLSVVTADGHSFKADVAHPVHGQPFRPEVCAIQDTATRYVFGWGTGLAESTAVVMDAIRSGVEQLGLFDIFYTDNGSGFVNDALTNEVTGFLTRLHATPATARPGRAQSRGKIERLQATLWKRAARELPGYNARDMDNEARRKVKKIVAAEIKQRGTSRFLLSWQDFLTFCEEKVKEYNNRPHRSLPKHRDPVTGKMRHMSPAEALDKARADGWEPQALPAEVLADLWRPYELRTTRRGEVRLPWGTYFSEALVPFGGEQVRVGYDIHDGSKAWVRTRDDGRLICVAVRDGNVIPEQPMSKIEHAREKRTAGRLKLIEQHRADILAESGPSLIEHRPEPPLSPSVMRHQVEIEAELLAPLQPQSRQMQCVVDIDGPITRFRRALEVERRLEAGEFIEAEEAEWVRIYQQGPEYRARRGMYEDFGESALEA